MTDETAQALRDVAYSRLEYLRPIFLTLHVAGGLVGLPLLIITFLISSTIPRQPALINFCITWVINSILYILSSVRGTTQKAPSSLCFVQAALIHGGPPMVALATFLVVFQIWLTVRDPISRRICRGKHCSPKAALTITLALPYVTFLIFFLISIATEVRFPEHVDRSNGLYCTVVGIPLRHWSVPVFCVLVQMLIFGFEIAIGVRFYSARRRIVDSFPLATNSLAIRSTSSLGLIVRITLFNVYLLVTFGASLVFLSGSIQAWPYMIQAALPVVAFLLFATQRNVVLTWWFWRKKKETHSDESMLAVRNREPDVEMNTAVPLVTARSRMTVERV